MTQFFDRPEHAPPGSVLVDANGEIWVRAAFTCQPRNRQAERAGPWHLVAGPSRLQGLPDLRAVLDCATRIGALTNASPDLAFAVVRMGQRRVIHDRRVESIDGPCGLRTLAT